MIKRSILKENITLFINIYVPNNRTSNYMRQKLVGQQRNIDESTIIVGHFNTPWSKNGGIQQAESHKEHSLTQQYCNQLDTIDIYRQRHTTTAEHTSFSSPHRTFTMVDHKIHLNNFKSYNVCSQTTMKLN